MNEDDLRVQRTRRLLQEALIDLMASKDYEEISVRDLTQQAQVGYRTFFHHYESKDALLEAIIGAAFEDFLAFRLAPGPTDAPEKNTLAALHHAAEHAELYRLLLHTSAAERLVATVFEFGLEEGRLFFGGSDVPAELVAYHFASSVVSLIRWWLENEMPCTAEEMADYISRLLIRPIQELSEGNTLAAVVEH